jgi:hypothetical protein
MNVCKSLMNNAVKLASWLHYGGVEGMNNAMKTTLIVLFVLCAASAFGQAASVLPNQPTVIELPEHPLHAEAHGMAAERPLVGGGGPETYTSAHGEVPLWEFGPVKVEPALGDVARAYRKEKTTGKKAEITLEKQGS